MGYGVGGIDLMVGRDIIVQSELRIEEIIRLLHIVDNTLIGIPVDLVRGTNHLDTHMTILQVNISIQTRHEVIGYLAIDVEVGFLGIVVIVFMVRLQCCHGTLHPSDIAKVVTIILVPATTQGCLQVLMVVIVQRGYHTIEVIEHLLLAHQVTLRPSFLRIQIIL